MEQAIHIRLATAQDAPVLRILNDAFNGVEAARPERLRQCLRENPQETVALAFVGEEPAGFLCGQRLRSMCYDVDYVELTELYVAEEFRRRGVATRLMEFLEQAYRAQGIECFQLLTGADNAAAQALYKRLGFWQTPEIFMRKRPAGQAIPAGKENAMKFYIGSGLKNYESVQAYSKMLEENGWVHTYDWTKHIHKDITREDLVEVSQAEQKGIADSDVVIILCPAGRGTHMELGMALALHKRIYLCAATNEEFRIENTVGFYELPEITKLAGTPEANLEEILRREKKR